MIFRDLALKLQGELGSIIKLSFLVLSFQHAVMAATPSAGLVSPASGSGVGMAFTFGFSDPDGYQDLGVLNILINSALDGRQACYLAYSRPLNVLYLVNDPGTAITGLLLNGAGSISNSQCAISGPGTFAVGYGDTLYLTINVTFQPGFAGDKLFYTAARDVAENNSGWQSRGIYRVTSPVPAPFPAVVSVTPASGTGKIASLSIKYSDATSYTNIQAAQLLINNAIDGRLACYFGYDRVNNLLYLLNDGGTALLPAIIPALNGSPGSGTVSNSQCDVASSSAATLGTDLTLTINLTFSAAFGGGKIAYGGVQSTSGNSGWHPVGTFIVPGPAAPGAPAVTHVLPANGSNGVPINRAIALRFSSPVAPGSAVDGSVVVKQGATSVAGTTAVSEDGLWVVFRPNSSLNASTLYSVQAQGLYGVLGGPMAGSFSSSFTTGNSADTTAPIVVAQSPSTSDVPTNSTLVWRYSKPVDPSSIRSTNLRLQDNSSFQPTPTLITISPDALTVTMAPKRTLAVRASYYCESTSFFDLSGNSLYQSPVGFRTSFGTDNQAPSLTGSFPPSGWNGSPLNTLMTLQFTDGINLVSAYQSIQLKAGADAVPYTLTALDDGRRIVLTPAVLLSPNTAYSLQIGAQLTDFAGNPLAAPATVAFTTGSTPDLTAPTVTGITPASGSITGTSPVIHAAFSEAVNPYSGSPASFGQSGSGVTTPIVMNWAADFRSVTLVPALPLVPSTVYGVNISGYSDQAGALGNGGFTSFTTGAGPDNTAPSIIAAGPPNGSASVPVNSRVSVRFSEPIDQTAVGPNTLRLIHNNVDVSGTLTFGYGDTLTFTPSAPLAVSASYTVQVGNYWDQSGNAGSPLTFAFTTSSNATSDTTAPSLNSTTPANGVTGISTNSPVVASFSEAIDPSSVMASSFQITTNGTAIQGTYTVSGNTVTFVPATPYPGNTQMTVSIGGLRDYAGNSGYYFSTTFTTAPGSDGTAPTVTSVTPANGAAGQSTNQMIILTFSEALSSSAFSPSSFGLFRGSDPISFSTARSADSRTVVLNTFGLPANATITVLVNSTATDLNGNPLAPFHSQFATGPAIDSISPQIVSQRPGQGATSVPVSTSITLFFTRLMNAATLPNAVKVSQNGVLVPGTLQVSAAGDSVQFQPSAPFVEGALVQVFVQTTAKDASGNPLQYEYSGQFTTTQPILGADPVLVAASGYPALPLNPALEYQFSQDLDPATVNGTTVALTRTSDNALVAVSLSLRTPRIIRIKPTSALNPNATYKVTVTSGLRSVQGTSFAGLVFFYSTGNSVDNSFPAVIAAGPPNNISGVGVNAVIRLRFNEAVNPLTVTAQTVKVTAGGSSITPSSISFPYDNLTAILTPLTPLPPSTAVSIAVNGVQDMAGNAVIPFASQFTTADRADVLPVNFVGSNIPPYATGVPVNSPITMYFNEPVDPGTLTPSNCTLMPGTFTFSADLRTVSLVPAAPLAVGRDYYFGCSGYQDISGNPAYNSFFFSFRTSFSADVIPPTVIGVNPENGSAQVPINAQIQVGFNEPVQETSLGSINLLVGGVPLAVTRVFSDSNRTVALHPAVTLQSNSAYTISIAEVRDTAGNIMAGTVSRTFTTGAAFDSIVPIVRLNPEYITTPVPTNIALRAAFSEPVNSLSVNNETFVLLAGNTPLPATVTLSGDRRSASLTPASPLLPGTQYFLSLNNVTDVAGNTAYNYGSTSFTLGSDPDNAAPSVKFVSPPAGISGAPVNSRIAVGVSEPLDPTTIGPNSMTLKKGGNLVPGSSAIQTGSTEVSFTPSSPLEPSTTYTIELSGAADRAGNPLPPFSSVFTTSASAAPDQLGPALNTMNPANGSTGVPVNTAITLNFSEAINPLSAASISLHLVQGSTLFPVTCTVNGPTVTFQPVAPLPFGALISVSGYPNDLAGNAAYVYGTFTTQSGVDATPPTVISQSPAPGAAVSPGYTPVNLVFSEPLNPGTATSNNLALFNGAQILNSTYLYISEDSRTVTMQENLPDSSTITVLATSGVTDLAGNPLANYSKQFTTLAVLPVAQPFVQSQQPPSGTGNVAAGSVITLSMSKAMNPSTIPGSFFVSQNGVLVSGTAQVTGGGYTITFTPSASYQPGALIEVFLESTALDTLGIPAVAYKGVFTIAGAAASAPLTLISSSPANLSAAESANTVFELAFNKDLDPASLGPGTVQLLADGHGVAGAATIRKGRVIRFRPSADLMPRTDSRYVLRIGQGLRDRSGKAYPGGEFSFTIGRPADRKPPGLEGIRVTGSEFQPSILAEFNKPINSLTVDETTVRLSHPGGEAIAAAFAFAADGQSVLISPLADLGRGIRIRVVIDGVEDRSGNHIESAVSREVNLR